MRIRRWYPIAPEMYTDEFPFTGKIKRIMSIYRVN